MAKSMPIAVAAFAILSVLPVGPDFKTESASSQPFPTCSRPSSVASCSAPENLVACAAEGKCLDIGGELTQGCLRYVCKKQATREEQLREELEAAEEARRRAEQEKLREEEKRRAEQAQGSAETPVPSGGAGTIPPPCTSSGGGADDCAGSDAMPDLGVKTMPKGNLDIYKK